MVDKKQIMGLLKQYFDTTGEITIDDKGLVSCTGSVNLKKELKRLPVAFDKVGGGFWCHDNQLTTLEGAPTSVGGSSFSCSNNQLTTLEGAPTSVGGDFLCHNNQLTTLEGAPTSVGGSLLCHINQLTTLEGAPTSVGGDFWCYTNQLTTLKGMPTVPGILHLSYSPTLPLLRCLLAKEIQLYPENGKHKTAEEILNRYAGQGKRALFDCQKELEDEGFEGNARW
jgi:uncharacterized protein (DUF1330 family)